MSAVTAWTKRQINETIRETKKALAIALPVSLLAAGWAQANHPAAICLLSVCYLPWSAEARAENIRLKAEMQKAQRDEMRWLATKTGEIIRYVIR
jgi:hypothetical protein